MILDRVLSILETCSQENPLVPPTDLYNEGWMLRIILDWFSSHKIPGNPLDFPESGSWFSEALLPSTFLPRQRGDKFAESWTHADGVIGHFNIGKGGRADLTLKADATHFAVLEAKMFSKLSSGTTHASYFNQAARYVGCIAETLKRANRHPKELISLGFYLLAPKSQIERGLFKKYMTHDHMKQTVERRVNEYDESKENWYNNWFLPTIKKIDIATVPWESVNTIILEKDQHYGLPLQKFYKNCLHFNNPEKQSR